MNAVRATVRGAARPNLHSASRPRQRELNPATEGWAPCSCRKRRTRAAAGAAGSLSVNAAHVLGWVVIAGSWFRSVPQIVRILRKGSVQGISILGTLVETCCYTVILGYNTQHSYPLSSYGDVFACFLQNCLIMALIGRHKAEWLLQVTLITAFLVVFNVWVLSGACGPAVLTTMQAGVGVVMGLGSRVPQIWLNFKRGDTGELSIISYALSSIGNLIRIFTTWALTSDWLLLSICTSQFLLNSTITAQCLQTEFRTQRLQAKLA